MPFLLRHQANNFISFYRIAGRRWIARLSLGLALLLTLNTCTPYSPYIQPCVDFGGRFEQRAVPGEEDAYQNYCVFQDGTACTETQLAEKICEFPVAITPLSPACMEFGGRYEQRSVVTQDVSLDYCVFSDWTTCSSFQIAAGKCAFPVLSPLATPLASVAVQPADAEQQDSILQTVAEFARATNSMREVEGEIEYQAVIASPYDGTPMGYYAIGANYALVSPVSGRVVQFGPISPAPREYDPQACRSDGAEQSAREFVQARVPEVQLDKLAYTWNIKPNNIDYFFQWLATPQARIYVEVDGCGRLLSYVDTLTTGDETVSGDALPAANE